MVEFAVERPNSMSKRTTEKTTTFTIEANTPLSADEQAMFVRLAESRIAVFVEATE